MTRCAQDLCVVSLFYRLSQAPLTEQNPHGAPFFSREPVSRSCARTVSRSLRSIGTAWSTTTRHVFLWSHSSSHHPVCHPLLSDVLTSRACEQEYYHCRKDETVLNKCVFEKLVRELRLGCRPRRFGRCSCLSSIGSGQNHSGYARRQDPHSRGQEPHLHWRAEVDCTFVTIVSLPHYIPGAVRPWPLCIRNCVWCEATQLWLQASLAFARDSVWITMSMFRECVECCICSLGRRVTGRTWTKPHILQWSVRLNMPP